MADSITFILPLPPSTNNLYYNVKGVGRVQTPRYKVWLYNAGWKLKADYAPLPHFGKGLRLSIQLPLKMRGDNDNRIKANQDLLKMMGIVDDDDNIELEKVGRVSDVPAGKCRLVLRPLEPPP